MVGESISWIGLRQSARQSLNFNFLDENAAVRQPLYMPAYVSPHIVSDNAGLNCCHTSSLPVEKGIQIKDEGLFVQHHYFPHMEIAVSAMNMYHDRHQSLVPEKVPHKETSVPEMNIYVDRHQPLVPGKATPHQAPHCQQKKFLIFDRSGEETRMLLSTLYSPICNTAAISLNPVLKHEFPEEVCAFKAEQFFSKVPVLIGGSGENYTTDEAGDYHEDTDEINALLYSENDEDDGSCDSKNEDEISTDHSPISMEAGSKNLDEGDEFDEEVNSWVHSSKRHKSLNGESPYKTEDTKETEETDPISFTDNSVVDLNSSFGEQASPTVGCKRPRGHKIQDTLRILQKIIPGSKGKDPVFIIDEAINFLKSLKATYPRMEEAEGSSCLGPCH